MKKAAEGAESVGAEVKAGADVMMNEQLTAVSNSLTLSKKPVPMGCGDTYVWYRGVNEEAWTAVIHCPQYDGYR